MERGTAPRTRARAVGAAVAVGAALAWAGAAAAQSINYTVFGGVAVDGYDANIQIVGASVKPAGMGLRPVGALQVYRLGFEQPTLTGTEDVEIFAVNPAVGGAYVFEGGQVNAMVGYAFVNEEREGAFFGGGGAESGPTTSVQALLYGMQPNVEAIAAYSWEPQYLWTNLVAVTPVLANRAGTFLVGADAVWEGQLEEDAFQAYSIGPAIRFSNDRNFGVTLAGGYRDARDRDATWYLRLGGAYYR